MFYSESNKIIQVVKSATPSVVAVLVSKELAKLKKEMGPDLSKDLIDDGKGMVRIGGCSGFFVSADGYVLTNRHIVEDEEASYTVIWQNKTYNCKILVRDKITDIAILKIDSLDHSNFPYLKLADSSKLQLGQTVIAIGNALGEFQNTVSRGIISGLSRDIKTEIEEDTREFFGLIQTDAAINPGNSGGPLIDLRGRAIGICTAVILGVENIGFAIPVNQAKNILEDIKKYGKVCRPNLGVRYFLIDQEIQDLRSLPFNYGAYIVHETIPGHGGIISDGIAEKVGLKEGDIILEINKEKITKNFNLAQALALYKIGDIIKVVYWHKGEKKEIEIELKC
ncbi:MAG: trypsin-like peptidase domain-containing protein [Candidatus Pacebacteria bacterium]|jgi:serine protease Do|nr:trypsin-like peptidase domain-containing protein [Candidatus Paceibacterota bacterium]MDD4994541.1 trypsin-like peptidase domain-containing protein [Candidatus Paceibacterota bacterium]MDD5535235.1 trypsin-like peptidase domain-containing protein [Candidatus Paceibacterota bacterium]